MVQYSLHEPARRQHVPILSYPILPYLMLRQVPGLGSGPGSGPGGRGRAAALAGRARVFVTPGLALGVLLFPCSDDGGHGGDSSGIGSTTVKVTVTPQHSTHERRWLYLKTPRGYCIGIGTMTVTKHPHENMIHQDIAWMRTMYMSPKPTTTT